MKQNNENESLTIDVSQIDNAVLKRLIREVQDDKLNGNINSYNRLHNRHNRSGMPRPPSYPSAITNKEI